MKGTFLHNRHQWIDQLPIELYCAEQVREQDRQIIAAGTPGIALMRRAASAVFQQIQRHWPHCSSMLVFCGKGNNGGDGYLVARFALEKNWRVTVVELGSVEALQGDAKRARSALISAQGACQDSNQLRCISWDHYRAESAESVDIVVDALLGTGIKGEVSSRYASAIEAINAIDAPVVAVDLPSGLCSDSGNAGNAVVTADVTVSFIGLKQGSLTGDAASCVGLLVFDDLAAEQAFDSKNAAVKRLNQRQLAQFLPRRSGAHYKNLSGHLLIIGGDQGMPGAVALAASAALRAGAGLVTVATRPAHVAAVVSRQPEVMVVGVERGEELTPVLEKARAIVIGPGLGLSSWSRQLLSAVDVHLAQIVKPVLLDADALNLIAADRTCWQRRDAVMTPHPGEANRLRLSVTSADQTADRFAIARQLLGAFGGCVVLKGAGTIVASNNQTALCPYGNPALATAGTGDVLSGFIGAYLAQGLALDQAAELGVGLHALSADSWVAANGRLGMTAGDLPAQAVRVLDHWVAEYCA